MMTKRLSLFLLLLSFTDAFVPQQRTGWLITARKPAPTTYTPRSMMPVEVVSDAITTTPIMDATNAVMNSLLLATIDGDISKMSDNEFAPVFMGGMVVMFGGLLSALFVGFIVNSKDLSAKIVADSYAQGADDEEFWKGLSEEERKKTQELLKRIQANQNDGGGSSGSSSSSSSSEQEQLPPEPVQIVAERAVLSTELSSASASDKVKSVEATTASAPKQEKKVGMFDDYGD